MQNNYAGLLWADKILMPKHCCFTSASLDKVSTCDHHTELLVTISCGHSYSSTGLNGHIFLVPHTHTHTQKYHI